MPRVSVICPAYNRGAAIAGTIASVQAQTLRDWELIVVSDGSDDDTDEVVRTLAERDERIRLLRTRHHGHPSEPRNIGLAESKGEIIAYIDHDDRWLPRHLELLTGALAAGAQLAATAATKVNASGAVLDVTPPLLLCWHPEIQVTHAVFEPTQAAHVAGLAEEVGGWRVSMTGLEDWDLWLRMADAGARCQTVAEPTVLELVDPGTRQSMVVTEHGWEIARFESMLAARAAYRALKDLRRVEAAREAMLKDVRAWYGSMAARGELAVPIGWHADWAEIDKALVDTVSRTQITSKELWPDIAIVQRDGYVALVHLVSSMTADHAERIGELTRKVMRHQMTLYADVLESRRITAQ
ncbi:glycosyltransferase family 2 protein [Nonomuraea sp. NPDC049784]|uniref:glycosyltransferase family 2 protein n=1 Tax=Nonomuraea sp. NPDC049784 TaxID=3154361 RepID=UPI0033E7B98B